MEVILVPLFRLASAGFVRGGRGASSRETSEGGDERDCMNGLERGSRFSWCGSEKFGLLY